MLVLPAFGAGRSMVSVGKPSVANNQRMPTLIAGKVSTAGDNDTTAGTSTEKGKVAVDRDKERLACLSNNIGVGNTFVWASKDSNTSNYASMVEDTENPDNNVCFVLVGMRSDDARINTSDVQPQYFKWGDTITCGSWVDEEKMEKRILEAKKSGRTWATVAGSVGGAGVGVGAMELFGNDLIGGAVMGQESLTQYSKEWYTSKINQNKKDSDFDYSEFESLVAELKSYCGGSTEDTKCNEPKYKGLIDWYNANSAE